VSDMASGRPTYGVVEKGASPVRHLLGTIAGRSCCGQTIVVLPEGKKSDLAVCRRCIVLDAARRAGIPDWD
jgi:hypothetical protein